MKRSITILGIVFLTILISAYSNPKAAIKWDVIEHNFGDIKHKEPVKHKFTFKNPGMVPLLITDVKTSCGCTVPTFPKQPILMNQSGEIEVTFDAKDVGHFSKTITVYSNTEEGQTVLRIEGIVQK